MEYQIQMTYEKEDIASLVKTLEYRRHPEKGVRRAYKIGYPLFGFLMIVVSVVILLSGAIDIFSIAACAVMVLIGVVLFRRSSTSGMVNRSWNKYPNKGLVMTYTFYKDHFEEEDEVSGKNEFTYLSVKNGNQDENHFFLFSGDNTTHMLKKSGFITGDPETFPKFILKKAAVKLDPVE
ncbi:MAG: YcxB family protein [Ruminiclostridium sp.]|nr:YcxB family protein [Ruminiclostridium sp.]MBQ9933881.1 YcxB family protein [Ruminiclostridium sp.]